MIIDQSSFQIKMKRPLHQIKLIKEEEENPHLQYGSLSLRASKGQRVNLKKRKKGGYNGKRHPSSIHGATLTYKLFYDSPFSSFLLENRVGVVASVSVSELRREF